LEETLAHGPFVIIVYIPHRQTCTCCTERRETKIEGRTGQGGTSYDNAHFQIIISRPKTAVKCEKYRLAIRKKIL
jgi:hypothetical protein